MGNVRKNKKANVEHQMDRMVRLQALEGAAGVPMNTWVSRGSPADVARGMAQAAIALPGGTDESWFAEGPQGLYRAAVAASSDDIVQEMIMGMSMRTGKPVKSLFYEIGKNKAGGIAAGTYDVRQARNLASLLAKRRMMTDNITETNRSKSLSRNMGVSGKPPSTRDDVEVEESGSAHLFSATPEDRWESLLSLLSDRYDPRGRKVMETLEDNIERLMGGNEQRATVVMTYLTFLRNPNPAVAKAALRLTAEQLELSRQAVDQTMKRFIPLAARFVEKNSVVRNVLERWEVENESTQRVAAMWRAAATTANGSR